MPEEFMSKKRLFAKILWFVLFLFSLWFGSQVYAYTLGNPGQYLMFYYDTFPIYRLDAYIRWSMTLGWEMYSTLSFLGTLLLFTFFTFAFAKKKEASDAYGSARWMTNQEINKTGMTIQTDGVCLGQTNDAKVSRIDGKFTMKRPGRIIREKEGPHYLIIGPTGKGKGVSVVIPTLLSWRESCIVYDIKKENWNLTSGHRLSLPSIPVCFEPAHPDSWKWNPLDEIDRGDNLVAMAQNCAEIVCFQESTGHDHWIESAKQTLLTFIVYVLFCEEGEQQSLAGIKRVLTNPDMPLDMTYEKMLTVSTEGTAGHIIRSGARKLIDMNEKERGSVISSLLAYLTVFDDPIVAGNTSQSDFSVLDLVNCEAAPVSIYHVVSPADQKRIMPLTRMFFSFASQKIQMTIEKKKHKVLFLVDEFPSLGKMDFFERGLAVWRGYGIRACLICQSFSQLYALYGKETALPDNCNVKLILGANNKNDAGDIEEYLGSETIVKESESRSGQVSALMLRNKSTSSSEMARVLMTKNEVMQMDETDALLFLTGKPPYKAKKIYYFLDRRFKGLADQPVPNEKERKTALKCLGRDNEEAFPVSAAVETDAEDILPAKSIIGEEGEDNEDMVVIPPGEEVHECTSENDLVDDSIEKENANSKYVVSEV